MKILVTGSAGFIGSFLTLQLLKRGDEVVGIDNLNNYYDVELKYARLAFCGIVERTIDWNKEVRSILYRGYRFIKLNLEDKAEIMAMFKKEKFDVVVNLAAQAGVRYSIENPDTYVQANIVGFLTVLDACRHHHIKHLVYASSSSVYGLNEQIPFSVNHSTNHPVSLYAATKKSNELMAHAYSYLFNLPTTGLRFFTVYGPYGRPDMAYFLFADAIHKGQPIKVFNEGRMKRDFTYVDDIVEGIIKVIDKPAEPDNDWRGSSPNPASSSAPYRIYNLGNNRPVELLSFIKEIEKNLNRKAKLQLLPMQPGDVPATWANVDDLEKTFQYKPQINIKEGLTRFMDWFREYYLIDAQPKLKIRRKHGLKPENRLIV